MKCSNVLKIYVYIKCLRSYLIRTYMQCCVNTRVILSKVLVYLGISSSVTFNTPFSPYGQRNPAVSDDEKHVCRIHTLLQTHKHLSSVEMACF